MRREDSTLSGYATEATHLTRLLDNAIYFTKALWRHFKKATDALHSDIRRRDSAIWCEEFERRVILDVHDLSYAAVDATPIRIVMVQLDCVPDAHVSLQHSTNPASDILNNERPFRTIYEATP